MSKFDYIFPALGVFSFVGLILVNSKFASKSRGMGVAKKSKKSPE
jgi:hypothetical protein